MQANHLLLDDGEKNWPECVGGNLEWDGEHRKPDRPILHFLKASWSATHVSEYLQTLYINSHERAPSERLKFIKRGGNDGILEREISEHWNLVRVGYNPFLLAALVDDLQVRQLGPLGVEEVTWTQQPYTVMGDDNKIHPVGIVFPRKFLMNFSTVAMVSNSYLGTVYNPLVGEF